MTESTTESPQSTGSTGSPGSTSADVLRQAVQDELDYDPKIDTSAVAVEVSDGVVTLRGAVGSYIEKVAAAADARQVKGVESVQDELVVAMLNEYQRDDADLRGAVLQALMLNNLVPSTVNATVADTIVTLDGTVSSQFQKGEAVHVVTRVRGVGGVDDKIDVVPIGPSSDEVADEIKSALGRKAGVDTSKVDVSCRSGTVTLDGSVPSWAAHDSVTMAAWNAPGVKNVVDNLTVAS